MYSYRNLGSSHLALVLHLIRNNKSRKLVHDVITYFKSSFSTISPLSYVSKIYSTYNIFMIDHDRDISTVSLPYKLPPPNFLMLQLDYQYFARRAFFHIQTVLLRLSLASLPKHQLTGTSAFSTGLAVTGTVNLY